VGKVPQHNREQGVRTPVGSGLSGNTVSLTNPSEMALERSLSTHVD
jgi:hypothetical protein